MHVFCSVVTAKTESRTVLLPPAEWTKEFHRRTTLRVSNDLVIDPIRLLDDRSLRQSAPVDRQALARSAEAWAREARPARRSNSVDTGIFRGLRRLGRPVTPAHSCVRERSNLDLRRGGASRRRPPRLTSTATFTTCGSRLTSRSGRIADGPSSSGQDAGRQRLFYLHPGVSRRRCFSFVEKGRGKRRRATRR